MEHVRMGIVGLGAQGGLYATLLTGISPREGGPGPARGPEGPQIPGMVLGAICDVDPAKQALAAEHYSDTPFFTDYREMITSGTVDAVVTTLPHYLHPEVAIYALEHGVHALVEKPAGVYTKQVRDLNAVAAAHPELTYAIMFNQRTNPLYIRIKEIMDSGELGAMRRANWIITTWWRPQAYYDQSAWRATWGGEGGGVLVNQAPHQLDLMQWICGMPKKVFSLCKFGYRRDIATEDEATALFDYGDATGVFITCTHDILGTDRLEILCDGGKIVVDNSNRAVVKRLKTSENEMNATMTSQDVRALFMSARGGGENALYDEEVIEFSRERLMGTQHTKVLTDFAAHIVENEPLVASGADGIHGVEVANAILLSTWLGREVELPLDEDLFLSELNKRIAQEGKYPTR